MSAAESSVSFHWRFPFSFVFFFPIRYLLKKLVHSVKSPHFGFHYLKQWLLSLFFKLFVYFTLQRCIGFAIHWRESSMGVHVLPILNPPPLSLPIHPSGSSQCTSPEHPVSCIEPGLAIHFTYDNLHVKQWLVSNLNMTFKKITDLLRHWTKASYCHSTRVKSAIWNLCLYAKVSGFINNLSK